MGYLRAHQWVVASKGGLDAHLGPCVLLREALAGALVPTLLIRCGHVARSETAVQQPPRERLTPRATR